MKRLAAIALLLLGLSPLTSCGAAHVPAETAMTFRWTDNYTNRTYTGGPIVFDFVNQGVLLSIAGSTSPFTLAAGDCVTLSQNTTTSDVTVTSKSSGACTISVKSASGVQQQIQAQVP